MKQIDYGNEYLENYVTFENRVPNVYPNNIMARRIRRTW